MAPLHAVVTPASLFTIKLLASPEGRRKNTLATEQVAAVRRGAPNGRGGQCLFPWGAEQANGDRGEKQGFGR